MRKTKRKHTENNIFIRYRKVKEKKNINENIVIAYSLVVYCSLFLLKNVMVFIKSIFLYEYINKAKEKKVIIFTLNNNQIDLWNVCVLANAIRKTAFNIATNFLRKRTACLRFYNVWFLSQQMLYYFTNRSQILPWPLTTTYCLYTALRTKRGQTNTNTLIWEALYIKRVTFFWNTFKRFLTSPQLVFTYINFNKTGMTV